MGEGPGVELGSEDVLGRAASVVGVANECNPATLGWPALRPVREARRGEGKAEINGLLDQGVLAEVCRLDQVAPHAALTPAELAGHAGLVAPHGLAGVVGALGQQHKPALGPSAEAGVAGDAVKPLAPFGPRGALATGTPAHGAPGGYWPTQARVDIMAVAKSKAILSGRSSKVLRAPAGI